MSTRPTPPDPHSGSPPDRPVAAGEGALRRLVGELRVHQIELETQNEELRRVRTELEATSRRYTELYDFAPCGFVTLGEDGVIVQVNLRAAAQLGADRSALTGRRFIDFVDHRDRLGFVRWIARVLAGDTKESKMVELDMATRPPLIVQAEAGVSGSGGECLLALVDVTEHVRREVSRRAAQDQLVIDELRRVDHVKDQFVALASHEMRTPLTSISGFSSTLVRLWDELDEPDRRAFVRIIDEQANRLIQLVDDVLVLSRVRSGALHVSPELVDVEALTAGVTREFVGCGIVADCASGLRAYGDPRHIRQALVNYVSNAIKYGRPPIEIRARPVGGSVEITVEDHGPGVGEAFRQHLFEEFSREVDGPAAGIEGTGLGLSIVRRLMESQGAAVWYEPNQPEGSRFGLRLPSTPGDGAREEVQGPVGGAL